MHYYPRSQGGFLEIRRWGRDFGVKLAEVAEEAKLEWQLKDVAVWRRTGKLKVGEVALVVAASIVQRLFELAST